MSLSLVEAVERWFEARGIHPDSGLDRSSLAARFDRRPDACKQGKSLAELDGWESRYGYPLPDGLRAWLRLSDGLRLDGPIIHPLRAIGPMVPFARMPGVVVQPESWFELGNPNVETICLDLGYRTPGGDFCLFTSGDDLTHSRPRIISTGFDAWFVSLIREGGREFWFDAGFSSLGDPWFAHRVNAPRPPLDEELRARASDVQRLLREQRDERAIAAMLGLSSFEVEAITRFLQHHPSIGDGALAEFRQR